MLQSGLGQSSKPRPRSFPSRPHGRCFLQAPKRLLSPFPPPMPTSIPMSILTPINPNAFSAYRQTAAAGYAQDNIACGRWPREGALQRALEDFDESLPQGLATPDNFIYEIQDEASGTPVGVLWFACIVKNGLKSAFVYDIEIKPEYRRRGYARQAFVALESIVLALGLASIGLHVFGQNPGAQALYNSLGYGVTGVNMLKHLSKSAP